MKLSHSFSLLLAALIAVATPALFAQASRPGAAARPAAPATAAAPAAPAAAENDPEISAAVQEALKLFQTANFEGAFNVFNELYKKRPTIATPRVLMAQLFAQANIPRGVIVSLEQAVMETPNDPEAYILLAELALSQGGVTAAELLLNKADSLNQSYNANPDRKKAMTINSLRHRISLLQSRGKWDQLQACLEQIIKIQGESPALIRQLGVALFQQKKEAEAKAAFQKAQGMPGDAGLPADAVMSQLYQMRGGEGDRDLSRKALDAALSANPKSTEVLSLGVMMRLGDYQIDAAKQMAEQLYRVDLEAQHQANPTVDIKTLQPSDNTKRLVATVALFRGEWALAESYFQALVIKSPSDLASVNGLALALCEQNDPKDPTKPDAEKIKRAVEYALGNAQKNDKNREFLATLGWVLYKAGDKQKSFDVLRQACADGKMNIDTAFYMSKLLIDGGKPEEARRLLDAALAGNQPFFKRAEAEALQKSLPPAPPATSAQ